jgi:hypothetical protein
MQIKPKYKYCLGTILNIIDKGAVEKLAYAQKNKDGILNNLCNRTLNPIRLIDAKQKFNLFILEDSL